MEIQGKTNFGTLMKHTNLECPKLPNQGILFMVPTMRHAKSYPIGMYCWTPEVKHTEISDFRKYDINKSETNSTLDSSFDEDSDGAALRDILESELKSFSETSSFELFGTEPTTLTWKERIDTENIKITSLLGEGAQGSVYLWKDLSDDKTLAIKVCKKHPINKRNKQEDIYREVEILKQMDHPFILKLLDCFEWKTHVYIALEFCQGGDLFYHLQKVSSSRKKRFTEYSIKFYIACIVLALDELHSKGIIYRDLKPENILIDNLGYPQICDFGLCIYQKDVNLTTWKRQCGSREYFPPEVIKREMYDATFDWWCLGILIYELFENKTPFEESNIFKQQNSIRYSKVQFSDTTDLSDDCKDLVYKLLDKDLNWRLGAKGVKEIKDHPWFQEIDWEKLESKQISPPYDPKVEYLPETYYFDLEYTNAEVQKDIYHVHNT